MAAPRGPLLNVHILLDSLRRTQTHCSNSTANDEGGFLQQLTLGSDSSSEPKRTGVHDLVQRFALKKQRFQVIAARLLWHADCLMNPCDILSRDSLHCSAARFHTAFGADTQFAESASVSGIAINWVDDRASTSDGSCQ